MNSLKFLFLPQDKIYVNIDCISSGFVKNALYHYNCIGHSISNFPDNRYSIYIQLKGSQDWNTYGEYKNEELAHIRMKELFKGFETR